MAEIVRYYTSTGSAEKGNWVTRCNGCKCTTYYGETMDEKEVIRFSKMHASCSNPPIDEKIAEYRSLIMR